MSAPLPVNVAYKLKLSLLAIEQGFSNFLIPHPPSPVSVGQREAQFCTSLSVPISQYGDSRNINSGCSYIFRKH